MTKPIWVQFNDAGFDMIWYARPGPGAAQTGRWHAGVSAGPEYDLVCVLPTRAPGRGRREERDLAEKYLSPGGDSPEHATELALQKQVRLLEESHDD